MLHTRIFTFNPLGTNCIVAWSDGAGACIIADPGMAREEEISALTDFIREKELAPEAIILTHGHFDHVWGVDALLEQFTVPVYMHPADSDIMSRITDGFRGMEHAFGFLKHSFKTKDIADGDVLSLAGTSWKVIHTPGHTPGGVCYYNQENSLLLSGDTLFAGAIGRTDLAGGDYDVLMESILQKVMVLPGDTDVIPGHGHPTSIGREAQTNPFLEPFNLPEE